jgi:hypothetical protein
LLLLVGCSSDTDDARPNDTAPPTTATTATSLTDDTDTSSFMWAGEYSGIVDADIRITPYEEDPIQMACAGPIQIVVSQPDSPIAGTLECEFDPGYPPVPGTDFGGVATDPEAAGQITIGSTDGGYTPMVEGPWLGEFALSPDDIASLNASFTGQFMIYGTEVAWDGTFAVTRD